MDAGAIGTRHLFDQTRPGVEDTMLYMTAIQSLLPQCQNVLDVGCGRGAYASDHSDPTNIFDLRGPGRRIVGIDVDPAASANPFVDEFRILDPTESWPVSSSSIDLVASDWTLEHVERPEQFISEVVRVLHVGGVFIARSISSNSVLAAIARLVPNDSHKTVLRRYQPRRAPSDVFPTFYRMNSSRALAQLLGDKFEYSISWRPGLENYLRVRFPRTAKAATVIEERLPRQMRTAFVLRARLLSK